LSLDPSLIHFRVEPFAGLESASILISPSKKSRRYRFHRPVSSSAMSDSYFPSSSGNLTTSSPRRSSDGGSYQKEEESSTDNPLLKASLEADPPLKSVVDGAVHPFDPQISALTTDSNSSHHPNNHPLIKSNQDTIRSGNRKLAPQQTAVVSTLFEETPIVQNRSVESENTGSSGFVKDHVGLTLPNLRYEHNSSPLTNTEKSVEPFKDKNGKPAYTFPSPPHSPRPSLVESCAIPCPPSPGGVNLRPRGSIFNMYPQTLIETSNVKVEHLDELPRLVQRNRAFHQSSNKIHIKHNQGTRIFKLLRFNWFHVFLRWQTKWSLLTLISLWTAAILIFASIYTGYDNIQPSLACGLGAANSPIQFAGAFAFSLETCTTVGYGLPNGVNSFFEPGCSGLQVIIFFQMVWSMLFNAFLITFLYNRVGRSETRSTQVIYSSKALVSIVDGQIRFQVRIFDCDAKHPVVEAHVRFYCVMKHRPVPRPLRLLQPDDELGGMLFLSFPTVVSHNIDMYSLLHPPQATILMNPKGLVLRQVDGDSENRCDVVCPVCGELFGNFERWSNHVRFQQVTEAQDEFPIEGTHLSLDVSELEAQPGTTKPVTDLELLKEHFRRNVSEILCLVEGIDPMQSGTFQALQSYRFEDIVWEPYSQFSPCLSLEKKYTPATPVDQIFSVDLDLYHDIIPDPEAAVAAANAAREEAAAQLVKPKPPRKRHRRIKTLSNRTSDSLFTSNRKAGMHDNNAKVAEILAKGGIETV
jgi:hypothetical protein